MHIKLDKREFEKLERAVTYLKESPDSAQATEDIKEVFKNCFGVNVRVSVLFDAVGEPSPFYGMAVYPEHSTIDKITDALMRNESEQVIQRIWEKTTDWVIDIDAKIFGKNPEFTSKEIVAMLLHEFGHIAITNSVSRRIANVMRIKLAMLKMENKLVLRHALFKKVLSLPILNACIQVNSKDSVKEEIKADGYVKKAGYKNELASALRKLINVHKINNANDEMEKVTDFTTNSIEQFRLRKDKLVRESVEDLIAGCSESPYMQEAIKRAYGFIYELDTVVESVMPVSHVERCHEVADQLVEEGFFKEAVIGRTKLKRLNPTDIDYVDVKRLECKSADDKIMLISFCRSKIDMIDYYMSILTNPKYASKYRCDNSLIELKNMRTRYEEAIEAIKAYKIPVFGPGMLVKWPAGYDG